MQFLLKSASAFNVPLNGEIYRFKLLFIFSSSGLGSKHDWCAEGIKSLYNLTSWHHQSMSTIGFKDSDTFRILKKTTKKKISMLIKTSQEMEMYPYYETGSHSLIWTSVKYLGLTIEAQLEWKNTECRRKCMNPIYISFCCIQLWGFYIETLAWAEATSETVWHNLVKIWSSGCPYTIQIINYLISV